jgi:hypothetical protein
MKISGQTVYSVSIISDGETPRRKEKKNTLKKQCSPNRALFGDQQCISFSERAYSNEIVPLVVVLRRDTPVAGLTSADGGLTLAAQLERVNVRGRRLRPGRIPRGVGAAVLEERRVARLDLLRERGLGGAGARDGAEDDLNVVLVADGAGRGTLHCALVAGVRRAEAVVAHIGAPARARPIARKGPGGAAPDGLGAQHLDLGPDVVLLGGRERVVRRVLDLVRALVGIGVAEDGGPGLGGNGLFVSELVDRVHGLVLDGGDEDGLVGVAHGRDRAE